MLPARCFILAFRSNTPLVVFHTMAIDNVVLNIYDLLPGDQSQSSSRSSSLTSFFSGMLAPLGMGAYHTSIDVRGFRYQFGAGVGISRTSAPTTGGETAESLRVMPPNVAYRESIILGQTWFERCDINEIIQRMRNDKFTGDKYHLANRNCNHFSETFATVLIFGDLLLEENETKNCKLEKFPAWVNRLAKTGTSLGIDDGNVCNVLAEARIAAGIKDKVSWGLSSNTSPTTKGSAKATSSVNKNQKKELTEKQKAVLAKLKTKK